MDSMIIALRRVRLRLTLQRWIHYFVAAALAGLSLSTAGLLVTKLFPLLPLGPTALPVVTAASLLFASVWAIVRRPTLLEAALEADRRMELQERLTSSLTLADVDSPMVTALHADARAQLAGKDVAKAFPLHPPRMIRWLAAPILALGITALLPQFDLFRFQERAVLAKTQEEVRKVGAERLKAAAKPLKENIPLAKAGELGQVSLALERMADQLASGELSEKQALAKVNALTDELQKTREALRQTTERPRFPDNMNEYGATRSLAKSLQEGNFAEAAKEAKRLQERLGKGQLGADEKKRLAEELKKLSEQTMSNPMGPKNALNQALAKASEGLNPASMGQEALEAMEGLEMSLEDLASAMEQLQKLDSAMTKLAEWQQERLGPSQFCRLCGNKLKACKSGKKVECSGCGEGFECQGLCGSCGSKGRGDGPGMGGEGRGEGNTTGPLPDVPHDFQPTVLSGPVTPGKVLADLLQRTAPDRHVEPTAEFVTDALVEVQQQAEQALAKEEIPAGSKEFVRQYFGSLEQEMGQEEATSVEVAGDREPSPNGSAGE